MDNFDWKLWRRKKNFLRFSRSGFSLSRLFVFQLIFLFTKYYLLGIGEKKGNGRQIFKLYTISATFPFPNVFRAHF